MDKGVEGARGGICEVINHDKRARVNLNPVQTFQRLEEGGVVQSGKGNQGVLSPGSCRPPRTGRSSQRGGAREKEPSGEQVI